MNSRIKLLSPMVANQIAAGEVIERPASVLKELLENSLDAESTRIDIEIDGGGCGLIRVRDNGHGIDADDLPLALSRHATSKIHSVEDLSHIVSLGFRGEALASIASVSHLTLTSSTGKEAAQITVEGETLSPTVTTASHPRGTTVEVKDLFFNTPVRRKFLRTKKTEFNYIEDIVKRMALSHFNVAFRFVHHNREVFLLQPALTKAEQQKRVAKLYGSHFSNNSLVVLAQAEGLQLTGWISPPEESRAHNDLQSFFINGRMVRDKLLNHALREAAKNIVPEGRHSAYVLYLQCDPNTVDVNVHPTKHEVRFSQPRLIHDFVNSTIRNVLAPQSHVMETAAVSMAAYEYRVRETPATYNTSFTPTLLTDDEVLGKAIGQFKKNYLLTENEQGLVLIDLVRAQQALFLWQLQQPQPLLAQPLLLPMSVQLAAEAVEQLLELPLDDYGIELQRIGEQQLTVRALPEILQQSDVQVLCEHLVKADDVPAAIAKFAARLPREFSKAEQQRLLQQLATVQAEQDISSAWQIISLPVNNR